jgi:hypothetical protein
MSEIDIQNAEDNKAWLLRPINWAYRAALYGAVSSGLIGFMSDADPILAVYPALASLLIVMGLLLWGKGRINDAANRL